jgi:hypothetical protein
MKYNKYEDIYPLTIILDRYNGAYSDGKWLAFNQYHYNIPDEVDDGDVECCMFWYNQRRLEKNNENYMIIGIGNTIDEAMKDLLRKMDEREREEDNE